MMDLFSYLSAKEQNHEKVQVLIQADPPCLTVGYVEELTDVSLTLNNEGSSHEILFQSILGYPQDDL